MVGSDLICRREFLLYFRLSFNLVPFFGERFIHSTYFLFPRIQLLFFALVHFFVVFEFGLEHLVRLFVLQQLLFNPIAGFSALLYNLHLYFPFERVSDEHNPALHFDVDPCDLLPQIKHALLQLLNLSHTVAMHIFFEPEGMQLVQLGWLLFALKKYR